METIEFNIYGINKEKEQTNFAQTVKIEIELKIVNHTIRIKGANKEKIVIKDCKIDDNSFDQALEEMEYLDLGDNAVLVYCKYRGKNYLLGSFVFEEEEDFNQNQFLKLLVNDFLEEIER